MEIEDANFNTIQEMAGFVMGCFNSKSNVRYRVSEAILGKVKNDNIEKIIFKFNKLEITVTPATSVEEIADQLNKGYEVIAEKSIAKVESYKTTPQYALELEEKERCNREVLHIDESTCMEFKNENARREWDELSCKNDELSKVCIFLRRWAKVMQLKILSGKNFTDFAAITYEEASIEKNITLNAAYIMVYLLSKYWKYGDELLKWYGKSYYNNSI
ncbi:MAG: hypothetical protein N2749_00215 [Clostridia bacterium]|nr:hypothetical protein [Clostridia bacterium]